MEQKCRLWGLSAALLAFAGSLSFHASGREPIPAPPPASFAVIPGPIPFDYEDNLIWVKVDVSGKTLDFILDSGAGATFLSTRGAHRLGLKLGPTHIVKGVERLTPAADVGDLRASLGGVPLMRKMYALDLQEHRRRDRSRGRQPDGLVGQDFFRNRVVEIDYKARRVRILDNAEPSESAATLPIRFHGDAMCVPVSVNGLPPKWTRLDTGCVTALEWGAEVLNPKVYPNASTGLVFSTMVRLGNQWVLDVNVNLHAKPIFPLEAGLLGNGLLSRYRVIIDGKNLQLILERN